MNTASTHQVDGLMPRCWAVPSLTPDVRVTSSLPTTALRGSTTRPERSRPDGEDPRGGRRGAESARASDPSRGAWARAS